MKRTPLVRKLPSQGVCAQRGCHAPRYRDLLCKEHHALLVPKAPSLQTNARRVRIDGHLFDSTLEGARYLELKAMQKGGLIHELECQPRIRVTTKDGGKLANYKPDFVYTRGGIEVTEDVKGREFREWKFKKELLAYQGIEVAVVKERDVDAAFRRLAKDIRVAQEQGIFSDWDTESESAVGRGAA